MLSKIFGKAKNVANLNVFQACVAVGLLVAASDKEIKKSETDKVERILGSIPQLASYKPAEVRKLIDNYTKQLEADFDVGKISMMSEISDISDNTENCELVFAIAVSVAKSDGEAGPEELAILKEVARSLGISMANYGLSI